MAAGTAAVRRIYAIWQNLPITRTPAAPSPSLSAGPGCSRPDKAKSVGSVTTTTTNNNNQQQQQQNNNNNNKKEVVASAAARGVSFIGGRIFGQKLENLDFLCGFREQDDVSGSFFYSCLFFLW